MTIIFSVTIIISILTSLSFGEPLINFATYLLPNTVKPVHYKIKIAVNLEKKSFTGTVKIIIDVLEPINAIILHQQNLDIFKENINVTDIEEHDNHIGIKAAGPFGTTDQEFYRISLDKTIESGRYLLCITDFRGSLNENLIGFYYGYYEGNDNKVIFYAATRFQPTFARHAFPCFDEPSLKTVFQIYIIRSKSYNAVSNSVLLTTTKINDELEQDEFEETEVMSTYLISVIISQLNHTQEIGICKVLARSKFIEQGVEQHFLQIANKILGSYEKLFNKTYILKKLLHVILPQFYNLDLENWGLIAYDENILENLNNTSNNINQHLTLSVAHKVCHQWFGDLVTLKWWNYTWLNEGFCTYTSYQVVDALNPKWNTTENFFIYQIHNVMSYDSLKSIQPLTHDVETPEEIADIFNLISYSKGAAIIRMLEAIVTPRNFQRGLANYTDLKAFKVIEPLDLYAAMHDALDENSLKSLRKLTIPKIMFTWDSQPGFPLVIVKRNYDNDENAQKVTFTQQKFRFTGGEHSKSIWNVPLNYVIEDLPHFHNTAPVGWLRSKSQTIRIKQLKNDQWLIVNKQQAYYYRVNYDMNNWLKIIKALKENLTSIHVLNRIQLIQDSFTIASIGLIKLSVPFKIAKTLDKENEYPVIRALRTAITSLEERLSETSGEKLLQDFTSNIIYAIYTRYQKKSVDTEKKTLMIEFTFSWLTQLNHPASRSYSLNLFNRWKTGVSMPQHLEKHVMCSVVKNSNSKRWKFLYDKYNSSDNRRLKENIFYALGCTHDNKLLLRYLKISHQREYYNIVNALQSIMSKGKKGLELALRYVSAEFSELYTKLGKTNMNDMLMMISSRITIQEQLNRLRKLANNHKSETRVFDLAIEKAQENIQWNKLHLETLIAFFESSSSGTTLCRSSLNTLLVICVTSFF